MQESVNTRQVSVDYKLHVSELGEIILLKNSKNYY